MKLAAALVVALVLGALPFLTASNYIIGIGISALIFTVAAAALNLVYGYTGLLSFAQARLLGDRRLRHGAHGGDVRRQLSGGASSGRR